MSQPSCFLLQPLKLFDQVELELDGDPRRELERDVLVGKRAAVTARFGDDANGAGLLDPLARRQCETIEARLFSKPVEFDGFETWIVQMLPNPQELDRVSISEPVSDQVIRPLRVLVSCNVGQADVVAFFLRQDSYMRSFDLDVLSHSKLPF